MGVVEFHEPVGQGRAVDDVDPAGIDRRALGPARGSHGVEALGVAAAERQRNARRRVVEGQRLANTARSARDDDALETLHGITSKRSALCAWGADIKVPCRAAASGVDILIASMTGYARAQGSDELRRWVWEARSVNGRNLEVRCRVPPGFDRLANAARN